MKTILSGAGFEYYVRNAKHEFEKTGKIDPPICFFNLGDKVLPVTVGSLFDKHDKRFVMSSFKHYFREKEHREIEEVVTIMESWFVKTNKKDIKMRPSEHPDRQEAVLILGRNKSGSKYAMRFFFIDPITRKLKEEKSMGKSEGFTGIIDYVFDEGEAKLKEYVADKKEAKNYE